MGPPSLIKGRPGVDRPGGLGLPFIEVDMIGEPKQVADEGPDNKLVIIIIIVYIYITNIIHILIYDMGFCIYN